ncbi:hypothetical protein WDU94_010512 [Cyamophila willieti]
MKLNKKLSQSSVSIDSTASSLSSYSQDEPGVRTPKTSFQKKVKLALLLPLKTLSGSKMTKSSPIKIFRSHSHCRPADTSIHRSESTVHLSDKDAREKENKYRTMPRLGVRRRSSMSDLDRITSLPDLVSSAQYGQGHSGPNSPTHMKTGTPVATAQAVLCGDSKQGPVSHLDSKQGPVSCLDSKQGPVSC